MLVSAVGLMQNIYIDACQMYLFSMFMDKICFSELEYFFIAKNQETMKYCCSSGKVSCGVIWITAVEGKYTVAERNVLSHLCCVII